MDNVWLHIWVSPNLWIKNNDDSKDHGDEVYFLNKIRYQN